MKSETWYCLNVKPLSLGFLILQLYKQRVSFISISFARHFVFSIEFPPGASNLQSEIKLKSPLKTIFFSYNHQVFQGVFLVWRKQITAPVSDLELQKLISKKFVPFNSTSRIRICPFLLHAVFTTVNAPVPQYQIATQQKLPFACKKIENPYHCLSTFVHHSRRMCFL